VTGPLVGSSGSGATSSTISLFGGTTAILAFPNGGSGATSASKLNVGPSFLAGLYSAGLRQTFGPYWVIAAGTTAGVGCVMGDWDRTTWHHMALRQSLSNKAAAAVMLPAQETWGGGSPNRVGLVLCRAAGCNAVLYLQD
jgi:hypothetical protein